MRVITQYATESYPDLSGVARAVKAAIGQSFTVNDAELRHRFAGFITLKPEMTSIDRCSDGRGWTWSYIFDLADVEVEIPGEDGTYKRVRYAEVSHWRDASTPCVGPLVDVGRLVAAFVDSSTHPLEDLEEECRRAHEACKTQGVSLTRVAELYLVCRGGQFYDSPHKLAELIVQAEPFGLVTGELWLHLENLLSSRGVSREFCLQQALAKCT